MILDENEGEGARTPLQLTSMKKHRFWAVLDDIGSMVLWEKMGDHLRHQTQIYRYTGARQLHCGHTNLLYDSVHPHNTAVQSGSIQRGKTDIHLLGVNMVIAQARLSQQNAWYRSINKLRLCCRRCECCTAPHSGFWIKPMRLITARRL